MFGYGCARQYGPLDAELGRLRRRLHDQSCTQPFQEWRERQHKLWKQRPRYGHVRGPDADRARKKAKRRNKIAEAMKMRVAREGANVGD